MLFVGSCLLVIGCWVCRIRVRRCFVAVVCCCALCVGPCLRFVSCCCVVCCVVCCLLFAM